MIASVNTKYGPPDILQLKEVQKPIPGKNELLIKNKLRIEKGGRSFTVCNLKYLLNVDFVIKPNS